MDFQFVVPVSRDGLLNKTDVSHYVVDEVLTIREITGALQDVRVAFRSKGADCMLEYFDTFYSVLSHQKDIEVGIKEDAWTHIVKIGISLSNKLASVLEEELEHSTKKIYTNLIKMTCYLMCQYMDMLESDETKPSTTHVITKGKGSKKKKSSMSMDWARERESGVKTLLTLVQQNIHRLWDPPVVEEEFVSQVTNSCYKLLENPEINYAVNKETREAICHILGVMVKRYNHGIGASLKIIQLLQHFEHLVSPLASVVYVCVEEYSHRSIVSELLREIGRMDSTDLSRDASGTRVYSQFLVEISEKCPAAVLPNISLILSHLDGESYAMRNGVLGTMGEILVKVLSKDDLDDKLKTTRDQFLEKLEDHIHDINSFVRSKVLQIWLHIVNEKCLPLPHQENLLKLVIGRLQDKASSVRKFSIQLITALMKNNPFTAKLSPADLEMSYLKESEKLKELMPDEEPEPQSDANETMKKKAEEDWKSIRKDVKSVMKQLEEDNENENSPSESLIGDEETKDGTLDKVFEHLTHDQLKEAVLLMTAARNVWPELAAERGEAASQETEDPTPVDLLTSLHDIFIEKKMAGNLLPEPLSQTESQKDPALVTEIAKQQVLVQYLKDSLAFAAALQAAIPVISQLLGSKTLTDVMEAIEFFVTGFEFGLSATMIGIRRMLPLIWSKETNIKEAVVNAYRRLYLNPQGGNARSQAQAVVKNLSALTMGATLCDYTCLEGLISELVKSGELEQSVVQMLWERFALKIAGTTPEESRAAVQLLSMAAGADMNIVKTNIDVLVSEGLGPRGDTDLLLARDTCLALLKLGVPKTKKGDVGSEPYRLPESNDMFMSLIRILVKASTDLENRYWIPLMEQAVNVIYKLAECPDLICGDLIKKMSLECAEADVPKETDGDKEEEETDPMEVLTEAPKQMQFASGVLARLLSLVGHVALRQLVHLDLSVFGEMKRRRAIQEQKDWIQTPASRRNQTKDNEAMEEEMGLAGAAAEDAESEYIRKICECEVVTGSTLLSAFGPLLEAICTNQNKYPDIELQTAASLALAKFMLVSSEFCDQHLSLLFTVLEKSKNPVIRANTIIAMGDLCFRFPNLIEPWTPHLYARLRDESPAVRKNTMQVLTHLILNDMVKVKGQISEMAICLVDHDERICSLAKLFFSELSKKGNAIYNIMPDMISRLSDPDVGIDEENFRSIMKYMFSFIQKDKHCESLVEKLCHRYRATRVDRQWRDLSYCLSMLSYNEKSIAKLHENFMCFADKLAEDEVYSCFCTIITKSKSFAKPEAKTLVEELEQRIESCHKKGLNEDDIQERAGASPIKTKPGKGRKTPAKTPAARKRPGRSRKRVDSSDEENDGSPPLQRTQKTRGVKKKPVISFSDSDDSDIEQFELDKTSKKKKGQKEKENDTDLSDPEPLTPQNKPRRTGKNKRRLTSLHSPLSLSNTPV